METFTTYGIGPEQPTYAQLREQNRVLRLALEPFAKVAEAIDGQVWVQYLWVQSRTNPKENICISADHVRAAQAALTATSQPTAAEVHQRMFDHGDATSQEGQG